MAVSNTLKSVPAVTADVVAHKPAVHFILQGKGGVGKSLVAAILAQYLVNHGRDPVCIDTDPVNQTFANYKALKATHLPLLDGARIDERRFDGLMEALLQDTGGTAIIDNGASSFLPLTSYMVENGAMDMLRDTGRKVFVHSVLTGGQALVDTLTGFDKLAEHAAPGSVVVWMNEYFGPIAYKQSAESRELHGFTDMAVYKRHVDKLAGIVTIPKRNPVTFGVDMEQLAESKLTFAEAINGTQFQMMARTRLKTIRDDLFSQLAAIGL